MSICYVSFRHQILNLKSYFINISIFYRCIFPKRCLYFKVFLLKLNFKLTYKKKKTNKKVSYTPIAVKLLAFDFKRPNAKVTVDGITHEYTKLWMAGTMKGRYFGGGMMVAPQQDRESGKISVMAMHGGSRAKTLGIFLKIFKGTHVKHTEMIGIFEGNEIVVELETPSDMQIDGETVENVTKYTVRLGAPKAEAAEVTAEATEAVEVAKTLV